jgi:hypothetical protein
MQDPASVSEYIALGGFAAIKKPSKPSRKPY